jgi:hypothetical protein
MLEITMPASNEFPAMFVDIVPGQQGDLTITRVHRDDELIDTANGSITIFRGFVQSVAFSKNNLEARLAVTPMSMNLNKTIPLWTYQSMCNHMLFDGHCRLNENLPTYIVTCTVLSASGNTLEVTPIVPTPAGEDPNNLITVGKEGWANAGFVQIGTEFRTVLSHTSSLGTTGVLELILPFYHDMVGKTVTVRVGCDHTSATCSSKFDNVINYLGFEFVPTKNPCSTRTD